MWLRGRGSPWRPAAAVIATVSMMLATVMGPHFAGMRAQAVEPVQTTTIPHTKITGDGNYFTFADNAWDPGNDVHTWSKAPSDSLPAEDIWYTVRFFGSAIDVYAGKNRPMGKVKYYIDGAEKARTACTTPPTSTRRKSRRSPGLTKVGTCSRRWPQASGTRIPRTR